MSKADINIHYEEAMREVRRLHGLSEELQEEVGSAESLFDAIEAQWEGMNSRRYLAAARSRIHRMRQVSSRLESLAEAIRKTAEVYRRNEMKSSG